MPKNDKCAVTDTVLCKWIDKDCAQCFVNEYKSASEAEKALADFEVMLSLLPENFDALQGETCAFCKGKPQKTAAYGVIDLAHSEPETKRGFFFGMGKKVRQRIGSLLPVSISICKQCRHHFRMAEGLKWLSVLLFLGIGIGICLLPGINSNPILPYGVLVAAVFVGYLVGKIVTVQYVKAKSTATRFNIFEIPVCAKMKEAGWFTVQDDERVSRLLFSKKPGLKKLSDIGIAAEK